MSSVRSGHISPESLGSGVTDAQGTPGDVGLRRECWLDASPTGLRICPRCQTELIPTYQAYCIATKTGDQLADSFIIGSDFGALCSACPTIVIRIEQVEALLLHSLPSWNIGSDFIILGHVNFAAVPEQKQGLPFDDDNPVPLVPFLNMRRVGDSFPRTSSPHPKSHSKKSQAKRREKAHRR